MDAGCSLDGKRTGSVIEYLSLRGLVNTITPGNSYGHFDQVFKFELIYLAGLHEQLTLELIFFSV